MNSIAAAIVTHNRLELLKNCINALQQQTKKPDAILVVNNGSTDGTKEWLQTQTGIIVFEQENLGSSGGFARIIREAYDRNFEWIWIMDDDAAPQKDCLHNFENAIENSKEKYPAYVPLVLEFGNIAKTHHGNFVFSRDFKCLQRTLSSDNYTTAEEKIYPVDFGSFVGLLLRRETIAGIGFPNTEFFIHHDDVEFCLRINQQFGKPGFVKNARIHHLIKKPGDKAITRNVAGKSFENTGLGRLPMRYFGFRNAVYVKNEYFKKHSLLHQLQFRLYLFVWYTATAAKIIFKEPDKMIRLKFFRSAIADGLNGVFDNQKPFRIVYG
ncbi:MAG TPA: glycosyltransferase, partial [Chitinophagaceae bacterium]|nr:glycosyltransferase [Chitinophagaceae bacterium]